MISRHPLGRPPVDKAMRDGFNGDKAILALQRAINATFPNTCERSGHSIFGRRLVGGTDARSRCEK